MDEVMVEVVGSAEESKSEGDLTFSVLGRIANGAPMDPVAAIRLLAGAVVELREQMANPSLTLPASGEGTVGGAKVVTQLAPETDELDGLFEDRLAKALRGGGFDTVEKIAAATDEELRAVNGIGPAALKEIRQAIPVAGGG